MMPLRSAFQQALTLVPLLVPILLVPIGSVTAATVIGGEPTSPCGSSEECITSDVIDLLQLTHDIKDETKHVIQEEVGKDFKDNWPSCSTLVPTSTSLLQHSPDSTPAGKTAEAFDNIYTSRAWQNDGQSLSGVGSNLANTEALCKVFLQTSMMVLRDKSRAGQEFSLRVLDAPSGDWYWMPDCLHRLNALLPTNAQVHYQGLDVSKDAVELAEQVRQKKAVSFPQVQTSPFLIVDLAKPGGLEAAVEGASYDIVLCHDALQHNPTKGVHDILKNFNAVGKYLLVDVDTGSKNDDDIPAGSVRFIDITRPPYDVPLLCADENVNQNKVYGEEGEWFGVVKLPIEL